MASTVTVATVTSDDSESLSSPLDYFITHTSAILSHRNQVIMDYVSFVFLSGIVCSFGIVANAIILVIYYRQGLDTTMNISFFALAISDLLSLVTLLITGVLMNPLVIDSDIPLKGQDGSYLISAWPHGCFARITSCITVYITAERCVCIVFPLKVKQIVTPRRATLVLCGMFAINFASMIPDYSSMYLDWKFLPERNTSILLLYYKENREKMKGLGFLVLGLISFTTFPALFFFTTVLIMKMKEQTKWRTKSTSGGKQSDAIAKRDVKTVTMVIVVAIVLIVCYTPGMVAAMATCFVPGFNVEGDQANLFVSVWGFIFWLEAVNSSVNIFFYYKMSTQFRNSFQEMFRTCKSVISNA